MKCISIQCNIMNSIVYFIYILYKNTRTKFAVFLALRGRCERLGPYVHLERGGARRDSDARAAAGRTHDRTHEREPYLIRAPGGASAHAHADQGAARGLRTRLRCAHPPALARSILGARAAAAHQRRPRRPRPR